jgi:leader peptidase (prepilin peptidase)/N-methyltransferase
VSAPVAALAVTLGLVVGSFLNVVAYRVPRGMSIVRPRSACPGCGAPIRSRDNIPVLSWLLLRGRCRDCGTGISVRYPLVEAGTAGVFLLVAAAVGASFTLPAFWWMAAVAISLALVDLDLKRIPNAILYPGTIVATARLAVGACADGTPRALVRGLIGGTAAFCLFFAIALAARGGFGFGDVKLSFLLGEFLAYRSWETLAVGIFAGFLIGGIVSLLLLAGRRVSRRDALPFGPSMVAGALLALAIGDPVARWYLG